MSLVFSGNPNNVSTPLSATVSAIVSGTGGVMRFTTSTPHFFGPQDYINAQVTISSVLKNLWGFATIIDATHFELQGSSYSATGTGTAYDLSLTPQIMIPTDGDSFSLQLSGALSALQALTDRTAALRYMMISREATQVLVQASGNVPIPPWASLLWVWGWGAGGSGGGGPGGFQGSANQQLCAGSGGAGARPGQSLVALVTGATSIDVVIGAGASGGLGSAGANSPASASHGADGGATTLTWHDGPEMGATFVTLLGGAGGGGGLNLPYASSSSTPVFTPGGRGSAGQFRSGPAGLLTQLCPGFRQLQGIYNTSGTLNAPGGSWPLSLYTDPVGPMDLYEGGASVANSDNATYAAALSYAGGQSQDGTWQGGAAGAQGSASGIWPGGAGGGGGGAGPAGPGGAGGAGGLGSTTSATNGTAGTSGSANSGAGGGGGGGGGNGNSAGGNGQQGGAGGSGQVTLIFMGFPTLP